MSSKIRAITFKKAVACGKIRIIIDLGKKGKPEDIHVHLPKTGVCRGLMGAIQDLVAGYLEEGKIEKAIECLRGNTCPACAIKRTEQKSKKEEEREEYEISCPDAIAKALKESTEEEK